MKLSKLISLPSPCTIFALDKNKSLGGKIKQFVSRFSWEFPQTAVGEFFSLASNVFGDDVVGKNSRYLYMHEYGHYLQSQKYGPVWLLSHGIRSLKSAIKENHNEDYEHKKFWIERDANRWANEYFQMAGVISEWEPGSYPL